jgi:hypothetical protein
MRRVKLLSFALLFATVFVAGCDDGDSFRSNKVPSKLKASIERQEFGAVNAKTVIYAMEFSKNGRRLVFTCPCYLADTGDETFIATQTEGNSFGLSVLPDAEYVVKVTYWATNSDGNRETQFIISK